MSSIPIPLIDQVGRLVNENQQLRAKSRSDEHTIRTLKDQYDDLAGRVDAIRENANAEVEKARDWADSTTTAMQIERDKAVTAYLEIDGLLLQAGELIMQAFRARVGDKLPRLPDADDLYDGKLPRIGLG